MSRPLDTSESAWKMQRELLRQMPIERKARLLEELCLAVQELAFAGLRQKYPDLPDDEIWLKLAVRRLGKETVKKAYGREIDPE